MQPCNFRFPGSHSCNVSSDDLIVASAHFWFHRSLPFRLLKLISSQMLKYHIHVCSSGSWLPVSRSPCSQGMKQSSSSLQDEGLHRHHAQLWSQCLEDTAYLDLVLPATCASLNDYSTLDSLRKLQASITHTRFFSLQQESFLHSHSSSGALSLGISSYNLVAKRRDHMDGCGSHCGLEVCPISQIGAIISCKMFCGYNFFGPGKGQTQFAFREVTSQDFPPSINKSFTLFPAQMQFAKEELFSIISKIA